MLTAGRKRRPEQRSPECERCDNPFIHPCIREAAHGLTDVLADVSFDEWPHRDEACGRDAVRDSLKLVSPESTRQEQLSRPVCNVIFQCALIARDFASAVPALFLSGSYGTSSQMSGECSC